MACQQLFIQQTFELSEMLAKKTFADKVFFSNSGNEAMKQR